MNERICIIGGGHSSGKLIKNLLDNNYKGEISIFSEEKYSPYERPPLSKEYLKDEVEIKDFQIDFDSKRKNINLFRYYLDIPIIGELGLAKADASIFPDK